MRFVSCSFCICLAMLCAASFGTAAAQESGESTGPRFAAGVLTTIEPEVSREDLVAVHDIVELRADAKLEREPISSTKSRTLFEMSKSVGFRRDVWCLEFTFKPLRMMEVDVPQQTGKMHRKLIWYQVYRVRNTGAGLTSEKQPDETYVSKEKSTESIQFIPEFVLTSHDLDRTGQPVRKSYLDRIIPSAIKAIERREMSGSRLLNSVEMAQQVLEVEDGRSIGGAWGVATWEDVDPRIDFFSVYVGGLSNAYRWQDTGEYKLGDPPGTGRRFQRKQLQLNFWRPGDDLAEDEREIRFGSAPGKAEIYGTDEGVAYRWVIR